MLYINNSYKIRVDLIWTADFAKKKIIVPVPCQIEKRVKKDINPEIYRTFEYSGKLLAMPFPKIFSYSTPIWLY